MEHGTMVTREAWEKLVVLEVEGIAGKSFTLP